MFYVGVWFSTIHITWFFQFSPIITSSVRNLFCCFTTTIMLMLVIISRFIIQWILLSTMIIGRTWRLMRIPIKFWFNLTREVWLILYKINSKESKTPIKKCNELNIVQISYYWPACEIFICLPIGENCLKFKALYQKFQSNHLQKVIFYHAE